MCTCATWKSDRPSLGTGSSSHRYAHRLTHTVLTAAHHKEVSEAHDHKAVCNVTVPQLSGICASGDPAGLLGLRPGGSPGCSLCCQPTHISTVLHQCVCEESTQLTMRHYCLTFICSLKLSYHNGVFISLLACVIK